MNQKMTYETQLSRKLTSRLRKIDIEKRRKNVIIYHVPEMDSDVEDHKDSDLAFVTDLLGLYLKQNQNPIVLTTVPSG